MIIIIIIIIITICCSRHPYVYRLQQSQCHYFFYIVLSGLPNAGVLLSRLQALQGHATQRLYPPGHIVTATVVSHCTETTLHSMAG
jgi:hypothetical protein